jgi:hypothetical protein
MELEDRKPNGGFLLFIMIYLIFAGIPNKQAMLISTSFPLLP